jgi:enterochelin esterase-like enzyme
MKGRVVTLTVASKVLRGNPLGDPHVRELPVWLPPGYDDNDKRYPLAFGLAGYTGSGLSHLGWKAWEETLPERLDRLSLRGMKPMIVALPDCFTKYGGAQYINSSAVGRYADHLIDELVPAVDAAFRTLPGRDHRGVFGKSSGGYGAIVHAMLHPDVFSAFVCHSGDAYWEFAFLPTLPDMLDEVNRAGSVKAFLDGFFAKPKKSNAETHAMMTIAMAACYDPVATEPLGFRLPCDIETGMLIPERWDRWLQWDPVRMIPRHRDALRRCRFGFVDCGTRDQYRLLYGARQMRNLLREAGVPVTYEEFPDNHSGISYRMDISLPKLAQALSPG